VRSAEWLFFPPGDGSGRCVGWLQLVAVINPLHRDMESIPQKETEMADRMATYKGKKYKLAFLGQTKFGRRAKLTFMDGSKEFWVPAEQIIEEEVPSSSRTSRKGGAVCGECGKGGNLVRDLEDGCLKHYKCCDIPPGG